MVSDCQHECGLDAEGINEFWGLRLIVAIAKCDYCRVQPFKLEYFDEEKQKKYFPDFLLGWPRRRIVVEVKTDRIARRKEEKRRFALIRELLSEHGFEFVLWKRSEIFLEPRFTSACLLLRYRRVIVSEADRNRVLSAMAANKQMKIFELSQLASVPVPQICSLILNGPLTMDWWSPLTNESLVSGRPIGSQLWPSPHSEPKGVLDEDTNEETRSAAPTPLDDEAIRIVREATASIERIRKYSKTQKSSGRLRRR